MKYRNSNCLAIDIHDLSKIFHPPAAGWLQIFLRSNNGSPVCALHQVNLSISQGEIFGLVGRNGQGKTTLIKCIASLLAPTTGSVSVLGHNTMTNSSDVKSLIGMVAADERSFYGRLTGWQNLMFFARLYGMRDTQARRRIGELAALLDFEALLQRRFQELSSGNKQRLSIIRALLTDPPVILLDEPTRSLDPIAADDLRQVIGQELNGRQGKTIFITSHNLDELERLCSRIGFISKGKIKLCATMKELEKTYFMIQRVTLEVIGLPSEDALGGLVIPCPPLECHSEPSGLVRIIFKRQVGDDRLQQVLQSVLRLGGKVLDCRTERDGLREIMDVFESSDQVESHEAVG